jgi:hypothetical protein
MTVGPELTECWVPTLPQFIQRPKDRLPNELGSAGPQIVGGIVNLLHAQRRQPEKDRVIVLDFDSHVETYGYRDIPVFPVLR